MLSNGLDKGAFKTMQYNFIYSLQNINDTTTTTTMLFFPFVFLSYLPFSLMMSYCDLSPVTPTSTAMSLNWLKDPSAVCNDGSPGAFYFSPASDPQFKDHFIIHLPGGAQCFDEDSCSKRWQANPDYMSSKSLTPVCYKTGLLDGSWDVTPLWGFNKVMVVYCSSDAYMGDVAASNDTWGWHMRGQRLVYETIKELIKSYGLKEGSKVLISGGSAGARGVMTLIDSLVETHLPKGAMVLGFLDSPFYMDVKPFSQTFKGFQYQEQQKVRLYNVEQVISKECQALYPSSDDKWKCLYGQYRIPIVKTDHLLIASQYDAYQLGYNVGQSPPFSDKQAKAYVDSFGKMTQNQLFGLQRPGFACLSWTCYNHDVSESLGFRYYTNSWGVSQKDALEIYLKRQGFLPGSLGFFQWLKEKMPWIDSCEGYECGGCEGQSWK